MIDNNDIYLYFEWIKQTKPKSVLDFGIFLQRIGAVSRQVMNCEIPKDIVLEGISMKKEIQPVYIKVYNKITNIKSINTLNTKVYDLIYFLDMYDDKSIITKEKLWDWLLNHGETIVADTKDADFVKFMTNNAQCQAINLEGKQYALIKGRVMQSNLCAEGKIVQNNLDIKDKTISNLYAKNNTKINIKIYIATHKQFSIPAGIDLNEDMYIPLHVGKKGKQSLDFIGDDTGDNISTKNDTYCELTGVYWIWKNVQCDIVGLCHYRRYFTDNGKILNRHDICRFMEQYDIIIGNSSMSPHGNVSKHYATKHNWNDMLVCKDVISKQCPEYIEAFDICMNSNFMNIANMMICRKNVFDEYCQWLFAILDEVEKRTDVSNYDTYQKRLYGFLGERLLRIWLVNNKFNIREVMISMTK